MFEQRQQRFPLGRIVATASAVAALDETAIPRALRDHAAGNWGGELNEHDLAANEAALRDGDRLVSVFRDSNGTKFYVITEWDRSVTTVLLPEDY